MTCDSSLTSKMTALPPNDRHAVIALAGQPPDQGTVAVGNIGNLESCAGELKDALAGRYSRGSREIESVQSCRSMVLHHPVTLEPTARGDKGKGQLGHPGLFSFHREPGLYHAGNVFAHSVCPLRRNLRHGDGGHRRGDAGKGREGLRLRPKRVSAHVLVSGGPEDRSDLRLRGAKPGAPARPRRHRQCHLPRQPRSRVSCWTTSCPIARCRSC